jgi:hypothetical protein
MLGGSLQGYNYLVKCKEGEIPGRAERQNQCISIFQAFASIIYAKSPLVKASQVVKSEVKRERHCILWKEVQNCTAKGTGKGEGVNNSHYQLRDFEAQTKKESPLICVPHRYITHNMISLTIMKRRKGETFREAEWEGGENKSSSLYKLQIFRLN